MDFDTHMDRLDEQAQAFAPDTLLPNALSVDLAAKEITSSLGHGMNVQAQKLRELPIATAPELLRFKPRIEPSLPFVQKTEEQDYGRLQLMRELPVQPQR